MTGVEVLVALVIVVGLVGVVVPLLPGTLLIAAAVLGWAVSVSSVTGWVVLGVVVVVLALGAVVKYAVPGRRLKGAGVPSRTLLVGAVLGVVGFFVVPVVGLVLGFVLGVYVAERLRVGAALAWPSTKAALRAVGLSVLIELAAGLLATAAWVVGVVAT
jgi:uncharacterized protein YqgC (DUF456 family)